MRCIFFLCFLFFSPAGFTQADTSKWLRAFPITDYIVELTDSSKVVQVQLPDGHSIQEKQLGLVWGVYNGSKEEAVEKGYGKCHLIKGDYYYFTISNNKSGLPLKKGDLLYVLTEKPDIFAGLIPQIAAHFIRLQDVYETSFFDRYNIFGYWDETMEKQLIDSMVADIRFTGDYFIENNPSIDKPINSGDYKGKNTLYVMAGCQPEDLAKFLDYIIARPRLYAGRDWKVSEVFATWLSEGAPTVIKD